LEQKKREIIKSDDSDSQTLQPQEEESKQPQNIKQHDSFEINSSRKNSLSPVNKPSIMFEE
jgi:hypothetical protein